MVYLPMSWLYGRRATAALDPLLAELREELYTVPFADVDWARAREHVAATDAYTPRHGLLRAVHAAMRAYERRPSQALRERALAQLLDHIRYEDEITHYRCIGPVNKVLDALVWHFANPGGAEVRAHIETLPAYVWRGPDGASVQGYDSSELWDTTFAVQAMIAAGAKGKRETLARAAAYIERNQVLEDPHDRETYYRHRARGGWPFSTRDHGWPISDCTAEGLKAVLALDPFGLGDAVTPERRADAIDLILSWQNADGGWATYENTRGSRVLEQLNPSEVFGDIMIDYSYTECTSACVQALRAWAATSPDPRLAHAIERGEQFLLKQQRADGSWEGSWGVCFTYGTWFGVWGLAGSSDPRAARAIARACTFLEAHQLEDGGWGETVESCRQRRYVHAEQGQAVMTSWALLALERAGRRDSAAVRRGVDFLLRRQQPDGRWPAEHIAGVFNKTSAIHYDAYLRVFPLWALAQCTQRPTSVID
jgi:squalene/oxidosqualene cyclase-like protein